MSNIYDPEGWEKVQRVYVAQFDVIYSLTKEQWVELARRAAEQDVGYTLDSAWELKSRPKGIFKERFESEFYTLRTDILLVQPLDWYMQDFREHLETIGVSR